jgi:hypothetical protein
MRVRLRLFSSPVALKTSHLPEEQQASKVPGLARTNHPLEERQASKARVLARTNRRLAA